MTLTARQLAAIDALLTAPTIGDAAAAAGVHRNTLRKWLQDAQFCTALHTAGDERIAATVRRLASLSGQAVSVLAEAMAAADTWPARIRAADIALARVLQLRELHELERRIAALEAAQNGKR
jgi:transposase-like protein